MLEQNNQLPIGLLLQKAGLISAEQLENALQTQKYYSQMKLGEILVLQQGLKEKTINFFVDRWQEILAQGKILPLGYYLKQACLLNDRQIEIILHEQHQTKDKFGELAVERGWIAQSTIDFFIKNLSSHQPQLIALNELETYNSQTLHLEKKYANYSLILSRILAWTGGIPVLTQTICQVFAKSNSNIPNGKEIQAVDRFVEGTLIKKWQESKAATSIRTIAYSLQDNPRCSSSSLLREYQNILLSGEKAFQNSKEQQELLLLGLVVKEGDRLRISNIIYQQVFNRDFVVKQLNRIEPEATETISELPKIDPLNIIESKLDKAEPSVSIPVKRVNFEPNIVANFERTRSLEPKANTPEPSTKIGSIIIGVAIALLIPLFLTIDNYYSSLSREDNTANNTQNNLQGEVDLLQQSCARPNPDDLSSLLNLISDLELSRRQLQQDFPENCQVALNQLRVMAAPQLGRQSRILEAIRHLCKVPPESEMYIEAEVWLKRWYNSSNWGQETKTYLEESDKYNKGGCPAAHFTEYET